MDWVVVSIGIVDCPKEESGNEAANEQPWPIFPF